MAKKRRRALSSQVREDRALCPVQVAHTLGVKVSEAAAAMRAAGVTEPLTLAQAKAWRTGQVEMPDWLVAVHAERATRAAQRAASETARRVEAEHADLIRTERVHAQLAAGRHRFREADMWVVEDVAFDASKDLARGASPADLTPSELNALRACGVDPNQHDTWLIHHGRCDQIGGPTCEARLIAAEQERTEERQTARFERQLASMHAEGRIVSAGYTVGQPVLTWYESRVGNVVKVNRVTVKVRFVGTRHDGYTVIEKNLDPAYVHPLPDTLPPAPDLATEVWVRDWRNEHRIYPGLVVDRDRDLFEVQYTIKSGQVRTAWFDRLRLAEPPTAT